MKSQKKLVLFALMALLGATLGIVRAHAQSNVRVSVNVPFDFVVGETTLKAGVYKIAKTEPGVLDFRSADGHQQYALFIQSFEGNNGGGEPYLQFHRYRDIAFLSKVVLSDDVGCELYTSSREKSLIDGQEVGEQLMVSSQSTR